MIYQKIGMTRIYFRIYSKEYTYNQVYIIDVELTCRLKVFNNWGRIFDE